MTTLERAFPALLQDFFHRRLVAQRGASAHTIASYRDTFTLFLEYAAERTGRTPSALSFSELDAPMVLGFLDHLETERGNSPQTRNLRLAAIRSFMRYASLREPTLLPVAQRVLAIPVKRFDRPVVGYLSREEIAAIIDAPDRSTWSGQRDAVLFAVLYNTGARVSEMIRLRIADVLLERASSVLLHGKGRKERVVPLWKSTAAQLRRWLPRIDRNPDAPVFPNRAGRPLSRSGVEHQLRVACRKAAERYPSLATRRISPHTLRHTTAMHLLQSGVDITVIALWLGHEDTATTHQYVEADLAMKEAALRHVADPAPEPLRFTATDRLLDFLEAL
ncbi:MAG: tyrosine-type recombinase/integrase [Acidobacteria bacterium]|nr:tyrosine-type recombinase/integrase [Acidobacteriota bacterium]